MNEEMKCLKCQFDFKDLSSVKFSHINDQVKLMCENMSEIDSDRVEAVCSMLRLDSRKNVSKLADRLKRTNDKFRSETARVAGMYDFDRSFGANIVIAGVDEVGRGPLAGPICAGAVILDSSRNDAGSIIQGLNDSKKLSPKAREKLAEEIMNCAVAFNIAMIDSNVIDEKGIAWSNNEVLMQAVLGLKVRPDLVLSDGYSIKNFNMRNEFVIKGDAKSASISAASIIAKVHRDRLMAEYSKIYPQYGFDRNSGYGTKEHIEAIRKYGPTPIHRESFLRSIL